MKKIIYLMISIMLLGTSCKSLNFAQNYDDIYYSSKKSVKETLSYPTDTIKKSIVVTDTIVKNGDTYVTNNYYEDENFNSDNYYDYEYSSRIRRFHSPYYSGWGYYDGYYTNSYWYSYDPWDWGISIYLGYHWWPNYYCNYYYPSYYGYGWYYTPYWGYYGYYGWDHYVWGHHNHGWGGDNYYYNSHDNNYDGHRGGGSNTGTRGNSESFITTYQDINPIINKNPINKPINIDKRPVVINTPIDKPIDKPININQSKPNEGWIKPNGSGNTYEYNKPQVNEYNNSGNNYPKPSNNVKPNDNYSKPLELKPSNNYSKPSNSNPNYSRPSNYNKPSNNSRPSNNNYSRPSSSYSKPSSNYSPSKSSGNISRPNSGSPSR